MGEYALNPERGPRADAAPEFFEKLIPALIDGEEEFCRLCDINGAEYKMEWWSP